MLRKELKGTSSIWLSASTMSMELIINAFIQDKAGLLKGKAKTHDVPDTREISVAAEICLYAFNWL